MSVLWMWMIVASAAPALGVLVEPDPIVARPPHVALSVEAVDVVAIDATVDLANWWSDAPVVGPLLPFSNGGSPAQVPLHVGVTDEGLVIHVGALRPGTQAMVLVNPSGHLDRWWVGRFSDQASAEFCGYGDRQMWFPSTLRTAGAPCELVSVQAVVTDNGWDVTLPFSVIPERNSEMRIGFQVVDADGNRGGTLDENGGRILVPDHGWGLVPENSRPVEWAHRVWPMRWVVALLMVDPPSWRANLYAVDGTYDWALFHHGRVVHSGALEVHDGLGFVNIPYLGEQGVELVAVERTDAPIPGAAVARPPTTRQIVTLTSVVFEDELELAYDVVPAVKGVSVSVSGDGTVLGSAEVDLERGAGVIRVAAEADWPDEVTVAVGDLVAGPGKAFRRTP